MRKFFNGGYGLGITYWVGIVGVGFITEIVIRFITKGYLTILDDAKYAQLELFHNCFLVALCIYMLLMSRAMIRAGFDGRRPGGWGWIGIVVTLFRTLFVLYVTVTVLFPSAATPKFMLELEMRQLNKQLPQDMGDGLVMMRTAIKGDELTYFYKIDGYLDENGRNFMQIPLLETDEGQEACQEVQSYFRGGIRVLIYQFTYDNDTVSQVIDADECLEWLATQ